MTDSEHKTGSFFGLLVAEGEEGDIVARFGARPSEAQIVIVTDRAVAWGIVSGRRRRRALAGATLIPAGRRLARTLRWATRRRVRPVRPFNATIRLLHLWEERYEGIYIVGDDQDELYQLEGNLRATFPGLRIVGRAAYRNGDPETIATAIRKAEPGIILVARDSRRLLRFVGAIRPTLGAVLVLVASRAVGRMISRATPPSLVRGQPLRLVALPLSLIHRLVVWRRSRRKPQA